MVRRDIFAIAMMIGVVGIASGASAKTAMFDLGVSNDGNAFEQAGWTLFELGNNPTSPQSSAPDPGTGWSITVDYSGGGTMAGGRNRDPYAATTGGSFTLDDVYIDFLVGFDTLTISNLDPSKTYDVQLIMFDDNASDGRTQTVFNVTDGANDDLGTSVGPGIGASGVLDSNTVYSVFGNGLSPDGSGDLAFRYTNTTTGDRAITNGVVITEIPEPASAALLGLGGLIMLRRRRA